jgi:hypothetical protein
MHCKAFDLTAIGATAGPDHFNGSATGVVNDHLVVRHGGPGINFGSPDMKWMSVRQMPGVCHLDANLVCGQIRDLNGVESKGVECVSRRATVMVATASSFPPTTRPAVLR